MSAGNSNTQGAKSAGQDNTARPDPLVLVFSAFAFGLAFGILVMWSAWS